MGCAGAGPPSPLPAGLPRLLSNLALLRLKSLQDHADSDGKHAAIDGWPHSLSSRTTVSFGLGNCPSNRSVYLSWPFSKREVDPAERLKAVLIYRKLFTQPRKLATLRVEFDAAVHEGSENGTTPELLELLQGHASEITRLMSNNWKTVVDETEQWPRMKSRQGDELSSNLCTLFVIYVEKTLRWLDYFVMDPRWLNLTAVNYAANAAREAASEVREARIKFEDEYELAREDLAASHVSREPEQEEASSDSQADSGSEGDKDAA